MIYLLIKVGVNISLIPFKSIFILLMISSYNGKVEVCLHGGSWFKSYPIHVINILIFSFMYYTYLNRIYYFYIFHILCELLYDNVHKRYVRFNA